MNKKNKKRYLRYLVFLISFILVVLSPGSMGYYDKSLISIEYDAIVEKYKLIKQGEQSELKDLLIAVVDNRLKCYFETPNYMLRLENCRKKYEYEILRTARENLKSAPSLGYFMLCVQDCPLSYSFCNGEDFSDHETDQDCKEIEVLCIEKCLDTFWRGNSLSDIK
ncbi:MAG: hypothetical protein HQK61_10355 [Desulfamplus sp.]|nr:hypothetical protein [Desulfamplus sp.]